jgi:gamma-glutamylcyclotransferase (GGCT)/AIG2-like uncharacterized protein YtfP
VILVPARVFVYGTLRRGQVNHGLLAEARWLGTHVTAPAYTLYHLGSYPGAVAGGRDALVGDVYRVDARTLGRLDRLEEYPRLYGRALIPTPFGRAWIYLYRGSRCGCPRVPSGDWTHMQRPGA